MPRAFRKMGHKLLNSLKILLPRPDTPPQRCTSRPRTHPIVFLPPELLAHIFTLGAEEDIMLPVIASHICRSWRRVALHTPALWRRIVPDKRIEMWKERIQRAKASSLNIQLAPKHNLDFYNAQWLMGMVTPHIHRWRSLDLIILGYAPYLCNGLLSDCCLRRGELTTPQLERLTLIYPMNDDPKEYLLFSGYSPRLRQVTLDGVRLAWAPFLFQNITYLDYSHHWFTSGQQAVRELASMLITSSQLAYLRISFPRRRKHPRIITPSNAFQLPDIIQLPNLKSLELHVESGDIPVELAQLIALFRSPQLSTLSLKHSGFPGRTFARLEDFFQRYMIPASVVTLSLQNGWFNESIVDRQISRLPYLKNVIIRRSQLPTKLFTFSHQDFGTATKTRSHRPSDMARGSW